MLLKAALILSLVPSVLASSQHGATPRGAAALYPSRTAVAGATRETRRSSGAVARAIERKLLLLAPRERLLRRFVDQTTGLVKRNVTAHCTRFHGRPLRYRRHRFICRVWLQPRRPSSGVVVVCHTAHHGFWVSAYHRRHRRHR
jgi:hypothetical protein